MNEKYINFHQRPCFKVISNHTFYKSCFGYPYLRCRLSICFVTAIESTSITRTEKIINKQISKLNLISKISKHLYYSTKRTDCFASTKSGH